MTPSPRYGRWKRALIAAAALGALGCSSTHNARTVGKGNSAAHLSLGGPTAKIFGKPVPLPLLALGATYGVAERVDVHGHFHATMAAYQLLGLDAGATWQALDQRGGRPALALGGNLTVIADLSPQESAVGCDTCVLPDLHATASWKLGPHLLYGGLRSLVQTTPDLLSTSQRVMIAPLVGAELRAGEHLGVTLEARWEAPGQDTFSDVVYWYGPGHHGAIAVLVGLNFHRDHLDGGG